MISVRDLDDILPIFPLAPFAVFDHGIDRGAGKMQRIVALNAVESDVGVSGFAKARRVI